MSVASAAAPLALSNDVEEINTKELAQRISAELKRYSIPQAIFAQRVLCRSQGTLSDLLRNPKPWSKLKSGRETFRRMAKWLQEPEYQRMSALRLAGENFFLRPIEPGAEFHLHDVVVRKHASVLGKAKGHRGKPTHTCKVSFKGPSKKIISLCPRWHVTTKYFTELELFFSFFFKISSANSTERQ